MNSGAPRILLAASVPAHFREFHLPWVQRLRELGCVVHGAADRITEMSDCVAAFNEVHDVPFSRNPLDLRAASAAGRTIASLMNQNEFDLVHVHTPVAAFITRKYAAPFPHARNQNRLHRARVSFPSQRQTIDELYLSNSRKARRQMD